MKASANQTLVEVPLKNGKVWRGTETELRRDHPDWVRYANLVSSTPQQSQRQQRQTFQQPPLPEQIGFPSSQQYAAASQTSHVSATLQPMRKTAEDFLPEGRRKIAVDVEDESVYEEYRPGTSIRRYTTPQGQQVIERGNQRIIVHQAPPPKRRIHPVILLGSGMVVAALLFIALYAGSNWWQAHQLDATYGMPRTYQTNALVYPGDTPSHPTHYIFLNLNGQVQIIEEPHGDASHAKIYTGPTLIEANAASVPVTGEFQKINGKEEMLVHIGDQELVYRNNGQKFIPQQ